MRLHDKLKPLLSSYWWKVRTARYRFATGADYEPDRTYWIQPEKIVFSTDSPVAGQPDESARDHRRTAPLWERGRIVGGDWDLDLTRFEDQDVWHAFRDRFVDGKSWSETLFYRRVARTIADGTPLWGCANVQALDLRLQSIDSLYEEVRRNGYRTRAELVDPEASELERQDEIQVHIGRYGDYIFGDGRHRLCMAKLLGVEKIPVKIARRHRIWVAFRREIQDYARRQLTRKIYHPIRHPDLADIPSHHDDQRFDLLVRHLPGKGQTLLDIGAHWGYFTAGFEELGLECTAIERSPLHLSFLRRLRRAESHRFRIFAGTLFDYPLTQRHDVVLALNIFHHFLKDERTFRQLADFLHRLQAGTLFFQPHLEDEEQMRDSYANMPPADFAAWVAEHGGFSSHSLIGQAGDGRPLFKLT
jgi:hypothetical protein